MCVLLPVIKFCVCVLICLFAFLFHRDRCKSSFCISVPALLLLLSLYCVCAWQINHSFIHSFIHSFMILSLRQSVDGNNAMLAGSPRTVTDRLQRVLNAAARIVSGTRKFGRGLTHLLHSELHWLDVPECIQHKLGVTVHRCLQGKAPQYLIECCTPTSEVASRQRLRSASCHQLVVPRYCRSKFSRRAFFVAGSMVWNSLPDHLRDLTLSSDCFKSCPKTHLFVWVRGVCCVPE